MAWYYKLLLIGSVAGVFGQGFGVIPKMSFFVQAEEKHKEDVEKLAMTQNEVEELRNWARTNQAILEDREKRQEQYYQQPSIQQNPYQYPNPYNYPPPRDTYYQQPYYTPIDPGYPDQPYYPPEYDDPYYPPPEYDRYDDYENYIEGGY